MNKPKINYYIKDQEEINFILEGMKLSGCNSFDEYVTRSLINESKRLIRSKFDISLNNKDFLDFIDSCNDPNLSTEALKKIFKKYNLKSTIK